MRLWLAVLLVAACGDDGGAPAIDATPGIDGTADIDAPGGFTSCTGSCQTTAVTATFGGTSRTLDRAFYGVTKSANGSTLHVEVHAGALARCPMENDPPADCSLIMGTVAIPTSTDPLTTGGSFLDFDCNILGGDLGRPAMSIALNPVAANVCPECVGMPAPSDPDGMIAIDVTATFDGGTATGHFYATHCDSMDVVE